MKLVGIILLIFSFEKISSYDVKYFDVPVDHFAFANNATFKLRYLINETFFTDGGPIFFYTGNEGDITLFYENTGFMFELAPAFNALIIFAEHRYYGESMPFGNNSFKEPKYSGYLSSEQALADYVLLLDDIQKTYSSNNYALPVIAFGGSYGGMLASWMRMKYPATILGAIAASAPILQFTDITPCEVFNKVVTSAYATSVPEKDCSVEIQKSWAIIRNLTQTNEGMAWLSKNWSLCHELKTKENVQGLINGISDTLVMMAMVNYPYPSNFTAPLPGYPVREVCLTLTEKSSFTDDKEFMFYLGKALQVFTNYTGKATCSNINDENASDAALGADGWDFQACTEMVMPMCSTDQDMFENTPWDLKSYSDDCFKKWGVRPVPKMAVLEYGGKNLKASSNIVFSNGLLDPWSGGGVLENVSDTVVSILIPEAAHHLDLRSSNKEDPESVVVARQFHKDAISGWVKGYWDALLGKGRAEVVLT